MKDFKFFLFLIYGFQVVNTKENQMLYRCGVDDNEVVSLPIDFISPERDDKRKLTDEFGDFHIYLDLENIKNSLNKYNVVQYEEVLIDSMNKAVKTLEALLKVKKYNFEMTLTDDILKNLKIDYWNASMIGSNKSFGSIKTGIDLVILARFDEAAGDSTLARAASQYSLTGIGQPVVGLVNISTKLDFTKMNSKDYFQSIILHEFTHILGFNKDIFRRMNSTFSRVDEYNITRYYLNSSRVLQVAKNYYNCSEIDGVELEESGGSGTAGSHWEARILLGDYMNGVIHPEEQVISEFTLAALEDTGYYKANYYTGGLMRYGKHKGCDFVKKRCVNSSHEINPYFENEFYDSISSLFNTEASCSSGRQSRTYYGWWFYNDDLPKHYQYFSDPKVGGFASADYYPVERKYSRETENSYYTGSYSLKGNGGYGTRILYPKTEIEWINTTHYRQRTFGFYNTSEQLYSITGETYSDHSFCYQSTLIKNDINNT